MTRSLIKFGNFLEINGMFRADAKFTLYIQSTVDLNGKELKVQLGTGTDCTVAAAATGTSAPVNLATVTGPPSINGFYITGTTKDHNIDGMNSKTTLMGATKWLMIADSTGVIGCSKAALQ